MAKQNSPRLAPHAQYHWDAVRQQHHLVLPEATLLLNDSAGAIVQLCDGRPMEELMDELHRRYRDVRREEVACFLDQLVRKGAAAHEFPA